MRKIVKVLGYSSLALVFLAVIAMGVWVYVVQNVEQPAYTVISQDGAFEVRDYPELIVAEVTRTGSRQPAVSAGFSPLAGYIFAKERAGDTIAMTAPVTQKREKIAMTAPVTQSPNSGTSEDGQHTWTIRFIMPSQYTLETLPRPAGSDVRLKTVPAERRVAIRFSGMATDELIDENETKLRAWMKTQGLSPVGQPTYAYYNDPFTPGPLRRNEVLFEVESVEPGQVQRTTS